MKYIPIYKLSAVAAAGKLVPLASLHQEHMQGSD